MHVRAGLAVIVSVRSSSWRWRMLQSAIPPQPTIAEIAAWFTVLFGIPTRTAAPQKLQV